MKLNIFLPVKPESGGRRKDGFACKAGFEESNWKKSVLTIPAKGNRYRKSKIRNEKKRGEGKKAGKFSQRNWEQRDKEAAGSVDSPHPQKNSMLWSLAYPCSPHWQEMCRLEKPALPHVHSLGWLESWQEFYLLFLLLGSVLFGVVVFPFQDGQQSTFCFKKQEEEEMP